MHIDPTRIDAMNVLELDELRHQLRLSARKVCQAAEINPSTYQRWMRHAKGEPDGSCPHPRTLRAVREVLREQVTTRASPSAA